MKYIFSLTLFILLPYCARSQTQPITIFLNSGKVIQTNYVYLYSGSKSYVRINSKKGEKFSIDKVDFIEGYDRNTDHRYFNPIKFSYNTVWGERTFVSERIKIYATSNYDFNYKAKNGSMYIKDDGKTRDIKYRNLKQDLSDNATAMKYLKKGNGLRITQNSMWAASVVMVVVGFVQLVDRPLPEPGNADIPPIMYLSVGMALVPWLLEVPKKNHYRDALRNYE